MSHVHLACGTGYPVQGSVLIDLLWVALIEREEEVVRQERAFFNYTNEIQSKKRIVLVRIPIPLVVAKVIFRPVSSRNPLLGAQSYCFLEKHERLNRIFY